MNGQLIINNWTDHPPTKNSGTITLTAGQKYDIKLEYYEKIGEATIKLSWSAPSQPEEIIPQSQLHPYFDIYLDAVYSQILPGSWLVLSSPDYRELYQVEAATEDSRSNFTLNVKTTRVTLKGENLNLFDNKLRETVVFAQSEQLELAEQPLTTFVEGNEISLDRWVQGLESGQTLIVSGKRMRAKVADTVDKLKLVCDDGSEMVELKAGDVLFVMKSPSSEPGGRNKWHLMERNGFVGFVTTEPEKVILQPAVEDDETFSEATSIKMVSEDQRRTKISLSEPLKNSYDRKAVTIYANVALATHGETVREVLGSGDGAQANQRFALKKPPLTYVSAPTPSGAQSTLEVRVNGVQWPEVLSLYGSSERNTDYIVRIDDDDKTTLTFGDGQSGARLPTGVENVTAVYRSGIGPDGEVGAESLTLLQTRPQGIRSVTNPLPASGAEAPEKLSGARRNTPVTVLTLDRIVSLRDFENFARSFAGIGKAQAVALQVGQSRVVHITIAAANGSEVDCKSELFENLRKAIDAVRDPIQPVQVDSFQLRTFSMEAGILVDPLYLAEAVLAQVETALRNKFSFEHRDFGQPVTAVEVLTVMQAVKGVVAVDLDKLELYPVRTEGTRIAQQSLFSAQSGAKALSMGGGSVTSALSTLLVQRFSLVQPRVPHLKRLGATVSPTAILSSHIARLEDGNILPAELLLLNPAAKAVVLKELTP